MSCLKWLAAPSGVISATRPRMLKERCRSDGSTILNHHAWVALDIAHLLVRLNIVDQHEGSIGIDPGACELWRAIGHGSRKETDNTLLQESPQFCRKLDHECNLLQSS